MSAPRHELKRDSALALALAGSRLAVWDWDIARDELWLSEAWSEMLGGASQATITNSAELAAQVHPADLAAVRAALDAALGAQGKPYDVEHRVHCMNGEYRWIRSRGSVSERDAGGRPLRMTGTNSDIHARRRAEDELRAREQELRLVTDSVPAMIVYIDTDERLRYWNRSYAAHYDRAGAGLAGRHLREVIGEDAYRISGPHVRSALAGKAGTFERADVDALGVRRELSLRYVPNAAEDGQVLGMYTLITDISEFKALERMKDEFVATVSHELRTPLTSIRASLQSLAAGSAGPLSADKSRLIEVAQGSCERLVRLVGEILDLQRMRAGRFQDEVALVDMASAARQAIEANAPLAQTRGVALALVAAPAKAEVRANADRLLQVLTNLIANAARFSAEGGTVEVAVAADRGIVTVSVSDRGPGVPEEFRPQMFQQFSQAPAGAGQARAGSGLGLAIAKAIVERYGGSIRFEPRDGGGAVFRFNLPAASV